MTRGVGHDDAAAFESPLAHNGSERAGAPQGAAVPAGGCIILSDSEASVPAELLAGLSRRGMTVAVVTDTPAAMVRLARVGAAAMLVAAGTKLPGHEDLLAAVHRYHPRTGCWEYRRESGRIRLHRLSIVPSSSPSPRSGHETGPTSDATSEPSNGHAKAMPQGALVLQFPHDDGPADEPLVSEEELAMLLGAGVGESETP